ncbi:MAG TPA: PEGA domain-containing protein [Magnetospirillaceae bacterium]|nr:PEGA domain-containing protein [Magnetospirillaceae bacterium]
MSSKKVRLAIRFFTYGVMTISTVLLTVLAVYYAMGYRFNTNLGVEQGGVIEFRTEPSGAAITIDGQATGRQTPNRTFAQAGEHLIAMRLNGYRDWSKKVTLQPGQLLWLDYVRYIPQSITTSPVREFAALNKVLVSPDHKWLLLQEAATDAHLLLADLSNERTPSFTTLPIPDAVLTKKDGVRGALTLLEWDQSSRYVLMRHDIADIHEMIRFDRADPSAAVNLSRQFGLGIEAAHFAANGGNIIIAQVGTVLRRLDIGANTAGAPFAEGVRQFSVYDTAIGFVAERGQEKLVAFYQDGKETTMTSADLGKSAVVAVSEYARHSYIAYSVGGNVGVVVRDPAGSQSSSTQFNLDPGAEWLQFSPKGRFVLGGSPTAWSGYDLETSRGYSTPSGFSRAPEWLDDFHFWSDATKMLRISEFDGQNTQDITSVTPGFAVVLSPNERAVFSINKTPHGTFSMQTSGLIN